MMNVENQHNRYAQNSFSAQRTSKTISNEASKFSSHFAHSFYQLFNLVMANK